jgi:dTDP-4-dehydrorhamnose 3,5-epimerase
MNIAIRHTRLPGVLELVIEPHADNRGWLGESFNSQLFVELGLPAAWVSIKFLESDCGVLRGMHWQRSPHEQAKLVACHYGEVFDVAVDIRPDSPTFRQWVGVRLSHERRNLLFVPRGFAHGMLSLAPGSRCSYAVAYAGHAPEFEDGFRWDDPAVGIEWPAVPATITSQRDAAWEPLS